tara:strand:- start:896 stop:1849 length:954 start_codon:yes stop_codon:yes gene_type:complete
MNEFEIIDNLKKIINNPVSLNLSDDVFFDKKKSLVASIDTYNENVHFPNFSKQDLIIKKIIRSSISDIISKGVDPKFLLISMSVSKKYLNKKKLKLILKSIKLEQKKFKFSLVGGDTTFSRKLAFTICVFGYHKSIIKRSTCLKNDDIYITGNIGDSSVGLSFLKNKINSSKKFERYFVDKYFKPDLAFGFHRDLFKFANSSMDISDGLLIDLKKIVEQKKLKFILEYDLLPNSNYFHKLNMQKKILKKNHLFNGDDYQIVFTANKNKRKLIDITSKKWNQKVTRIGTIVNTNANYIRINNKLKKIKDYQGYIHNFI